MAAGSVVDIGGYTGNFDTLVTEHIAQINPSMALITHWHTDHYILGYFLNTNHWIGMQNNDYDYRAELLLDYFIGSEDCHVDLIPDEYNGKKVASINDSIILWKGNGKGYEHDHFIDYHSRGLILQIKNNDHNMVFPGDCYYLIPVIIWVI